MSLYKFLVGPLQDRALAGSGGVMASQASSRRGGPVKPPRPPRKGKVVNPLTYQPRKSQRKAA